MKALFFVIILVLGLLICYFKGHRRFEIFLTALIFIPNAIPYPTSGLPAHRFFILAFWLSIILHGEWYKMRKNPMIVFLMILLLSCWITGFSDSRISPFSRFWKPSIHFVTEYGLLFIGAATLYTESTWNQTREFVVNVSIILCGYALLTLVTGVDIYSSYIAELFGDEGGCDFTPGGDTRIRICSFLYNSHKFGYFCAVLTILFIYFHLRRKFQGKEWIAAILALLGLIISGSRSSLIAASIGFVIIFLFGLKLKRRIRYILALCLLLLPISQVPMVQKSLESVAVIFSDSDGQQLGSSIDMRQNQLEISLLFFEKNPFWGNGFDYYVEVLKRDDVTIKKEGLYGAESYIFILLIERGIIQIACILLLWIALIVYFIKNHFKYKLEAAVGLALFASFMSVSITTGNSGKWEFVLPFVGVFMDEFNRCKLYSLSK